MQNRRQFVRVATGTGLAISLGHSLQASDAPSDIRITRIVRFDLISRRSKVAGKNARLDVHGDTATDPMVRLYTNAGHQGLGHSRANQKELIQLLGKDPMSFLRQERQQIVAPTGRWTMPLWDLCGQILQQPVYRLLGGKGPEQVPVYDGSIYFADLLPEYEERPLDRFRQEIDMSLAAGHRAVKVKIGRGAKWMPRDKGDARDLQVVQTIREHAGPELLIGVDANNGYDLPRAKRWVDETAALRLAFLEEMFPEEIEPCLELKSHIRSRSLDTLVADGETQQSLEPLQPLIEAKALDVLQGDMNHFAAEGILQEAAWAAASGALVAPHNWGSLIGYYMQLHIGRAITNFYRAEHDPLTNDILIADGYEVKEGASSVPDAPGLGLKLNEEEFANKAIVNFDLRV